MKWFSVMDMHTGGYTKAEQTLWYIQAPSYDAVRKIMLDITGNDVDNSACECCGPDYSVFACDLNWVQENAQQENATVIPWKDPDNSNRSRDSIKLSFTKPTE